MIIDLNGKLVFYDPTPNDIFWTGPNPKYFQTNNKMLLEIGIRFQCLIGYTTLWEKEKNAGYQHFIFFFSTMFSTGFLLGVDKSRDCVGKS